MISIRLTILISDLMFMFVIERQACLGRLHPFLSPDQQHSHGGQDS